METLMVTTNHILSQVATVAGRQTCSSVNTVQNFVYTGDDVSSSMASSSLISTSSTHGMTPCFSIHCGLKQFGEIPIYFVVVLPVLLIVWLVLLVLHSKEPSKLVLKRTHGHFGND